MELKPSVFAVAIGFLAVGWALRSALSRCGLDYAKQINRKLTAIMGTQEQLAAELVALTPQVTSLGTGVQQLNTTVAALNTRIAELEAALANAGNTTPAVDAALLALKAEVATAVAQLPPVTPPTPDPEPEPVTDPSAP